MDINGIDPKDISVVVRGLITGAKDADEKQQFTKRALRSIREHLPGAQIILSTWKGADPAGLDYDELVLSDSPQNLYMMLADHTPRLITTNNQLISTNAGLAKARGKYTIVMRSDMMLIGTGFIRYFQKYNADGAKALKKKVVVLPTYNLHRKADAFLFNTCDWFFFGLTEDLKDIYDIPLWEEKDFVGEKIDGVYPRDENLGAEQYLWTTFLRKHQPVDFPYTAYRMPEALDATERSYAENTIMVPANQAGIICLKMPHAGYGAVPMMSQGLYTLGDYKRMYNAYNKHKVPYMRNIFEDAIYWLQMRARSRMRNLAPGFYKTFINTVRRSQGSTDLIK